MPAQNLKRKKILSAIVLVQDCMHLAGKKLPPATVKHIARHIVHLLPAKMMLHVMRHGLASKYALEAMKLTVPYMRAAA